VGVWKGGIVTPKVSILVFLDQALKVPAPSLFRRVVPVSILVFLDQALKAGKPTTQRRKRWSFNPCFPGSSAERQSPPHCRLKPVYVSILVFLDQALKAKVKDGTIPPVIAFQSLFSWIKR